MAAHLGVSRVKHGGRLGSCSAATCALVLGRTGIPWVSKGFVLLLCLLLKDLVSVVLFCKETLFVVNSY